MGMHAAASLPPQLQKLNNKKSSKDIVAINSNNNTINKITVNISASQSLKIEKKAKSQLGKEHLLHSTKDPTAVQAFTETHAVDGTIDINLMNKTSNNIFNSLSEKKKEMIQNFPVQQDGSKLISEVVMLPTNNKYTHSQSTPKPIIKPKKSMSNSQTFSAQNKTTAAAASGGMKSQMATTT